MKILYIFFILWIPSGLFSQSIYKQFKKLSKPERHWVIGHLFKAKKAFRITRQVEFTVDSIKKTGIIGNDILGGKLDAFKHTYWMASLSAGIGKRKSLKLGNAHEKGNYLQFKKHQLEENSLPDSVSSAMDLKNNYSGVHLVDISKKISQIAIQQSVLDALKEGRLTIIKKDLQGNFLTSDDKLINMKDWVGKWNIPKCLVSSNHYQ